MAIRLNDVPDRTSEIIESGLREVHSGPGVGGLADVMEFLASLPSPQEILALKASPEVEARVDELTRRSRDHGLTPAEEQEWARYEFAEHLVRKAKMRAYGNLHSE